MGNYEYEPIKKLKENNKKKMFFMFLTIFMFLGISLATIYFVYRYNDTRENTVTSGLVDIDFSEQSPSINLQKTVPMSDELGKQNDPYIFTVENISKIPLRLKIGIDILNSTIDLSAIRYALYIDNKEIKVDNLGNLDSENNFHIIEQFAPGAKIEAKLVFWIDYYYEKAGGTFSGKIRVEGEQYDIIYEKPVTASDTIKKSVVSNVTDTCTASDFNGGLVAINQDGTLYQEGSEQEIREYRYVGPEVNNYIYFNCQDGKEQNGDNCEIWRILGIFKDESGTEHLKIVRNETLKGDMMPAKFSAGNGKQYSIRYSSTDNAYWNSGGNYNNDWATGGLQYWLNAGSDKETSQPSDGYMSYLSKNAKSMIENTKYYLGTFMDSSTTCNSASNTSGSSITKTTIETYQYERAVNEFYTQDEAAGCERFDTYPNTFERKGGKIWPNNSATWEGYISLMYPSDEKYTENSCNWTRTVNSSNGASSSWLQTTANHSTYEWLLSPSSGDSFGVAGWSFGGRVNNLSVVGTNAVRPSLNLISGATIVDGEGTVNSPYQLKSGQ